jgi:two-component system response regulator AtoC
MGAARLPTLAELERDYIEHVLEHVGGASLEAARVLGIGRTTLWRKLKEEPRRRSTGRR